MADDLAEYSHMWDGTEDGWVLLRSATGSGGYLPYNGKGFAMIIEDEETCALVCRRMIEAGCNVLDDLPEQLT